MPAIFVDSRPAFAAPTAAAAAVPPPTAPDQGLSAQLAGLSNTPAPTVEQGGGNVCSAVTQLAASALRGVRNSLCWSSRGETVPHYDPVRLNAWVVAGSERENRAEAASRIRQCTQPWHELDLSSLGLTHMPPLPTYFLSLNVSNNELVQLGELPSGLGQLICSHNPLEALPALPASLGKLFMSDVPIFTLPTLPPGLRTLCARGCGLVTLPAAWPSTLTELDLADNALTSVPPLPQNLISCNLDNNRLTEIPDTIAGLARLHQPLSLVGNPLSAQAQARADALIATLGPVQVHDELTVPLAQAVARWQPDVARDEVTARWEGFAKEEHAPQFSQFLERLRRTSNAANPAVRPAFEAAVASWLKELEVNGPLRQYAFATAVSALDSCEDRVTCSFMMMERARQNFQISEGLYDDRPAELLALSKGLMRAAELDRISQETIAALIASGQQVDEVEVNLGYHIKLAVRLDLPVPVRGMEMAYFRSSKLTQADLDQAAARIEGLKFDQFLSTWEPWHQVLTRWNAQDVSGAQRKLADEVADPKSFEQYTIAFIQGNMDISPELAADADLQREAGPRVLADLQHRIYGPLTQRYLQAKGMSLYG